MWDELKKLFTHSSIYGLGNILGKVTGFLLIPFYTHYLHPTQYGRLELLDLSLSFMGLMLGALATAPLLRFYYHFENDRMKKRVFSTALLTAFTAALPLAFAGLHFAPQLSILLLKSAAYAGYLKVISLSFLLTCMGTVAWEYLIARQRATLIVSLKLPLLALALFLNIYLVAFAHLGVLGVLYSGLITNFVGVCIVVSLMLKEVGLGFDLGILKTCVAFGFPLIFSNLGAFALNFSDRFFLQYFSTTSVVGTYSLGYKFGFMVSFLVIQPFALIWSSEIYLIDKRTDGRSVFSKLANHFCLTLVVVALGLSVLSKEVITILADPSFRAASAVIPIVALAYVFYGMASYFRAGMYISKKTVYIGAIGIGGGALDILLNFILIPRYGAMGAAWATLMSFGAMAGLTYGFAQKAYHVPYRLPRLSLPILIGVAVYLLSTCLSVSSLWVTALLKAMCVPAFVAIIYVLGFFDKSETEQIRIAFSRFRTRFRHTEAIASGR
jgi:O-antigen/teichoic acid export membrane protein